MMVEMIGFAVMFLLTLHGCSAGPVPTTEAPQQTPFQALMNARTIAARVYERASDAYDTFIQEEFGGDSGYCVEDITWDELFSVRIPTLEWRNLGDEERLQRLRRDLQLFELFLDEVLLDEQDKEGHTDTANKVEEATNHLDTLMAAIAVANDVLGFTAPTDVTEIMSTSLRDPGTESARAIRDCVVLRDFKTLVERGHRDFTLLSRRYS
ncbi:Hypp1913 [Branchiostoma lanceolatum]|uniref:Hypp1913 protein n=1 Tax=Branchiostoma lanceolatum TaxID=7740 RepID=A0A8J9ZPP7_BRALA|nr:Hypp1913 [Branchiostoma lanceolatum]